LNYRLGQKRANRDNPASPWVHADNFHLLFGSNFDGGTVGMATVETMCGERSGGVNQVSYRFIFVLLQPQKPQSTCCFDL